MLLMAGLMLAAGCIDEKGEYTLNPNGSGKITYEITMAPMSPGFEGQQSDPNEQIAQHVRQILQQSEGVDVWSDVSFKMTDNGKMYFKGTAYFPDVNKLQIYNSGSAFPMKTNENGEIIIQLETEETDPGAKEDAAPAPAKLSEEELNQKVQQTKAEYAQTRMIMSSFLPTLKVESTLHLPGKIKEVSNFEKIDDRTVRFVLSGEKLLKTLDEAMADDELLKEQLREGKDPGEFSEEDLEINEKLFGQKAPVRIVVIPDKKHRFDYDTEVAAAKKNYQPMLEKLKLAKPSAEKAE